MRKRLEISIGQHSDKGCKDSNQDFHGALIPDGPALASKGIVVALADGISTSAVSHIAAETAIKSLLTDYYCTSDAWSVKTAVQRVISATNSWLHAETKRNQNVLDLEKGHICTLTALVLKGRRAHLFHVGDARVFRLWGETLEQITEDHRVVLSSQESYLSRALGIGPNVEIDYGVIDLSEGDVFVLTTDGVHEHASPEFIARTIRTSTDDLEFASRRIVAEALAGGSRDNLTVQIFEIKSLPDWDAGEFTGQARVLPPAPLLEPRMVLDGYTIVRPLHESSRSHLYLVIDPSTAGLAVIKVPSIDLRDTPAYLERFMLEEWIARRLDSPHIVKTHAPERTRTHLYIAMEFIDGQTLAQWMRDHPTPDLETVRRIVEQIATGLHAFHRREMVHQDLRPENVMLDANGMVTIIDFGSTKVAGVEETRPTRGGGEILGTFQYTAPEYFLGELGTPRSDLFSLGVITYQMLTGRLPFGPEVARTRTRAQQQSLRYASTSGGVPEWVDAALRKAVEPDPARRYEELSEFLYDLRHPNSALLGASRFPLYEQNPVLIWQVLSLVLALCVGYLLATRWS